MSEWKEFIAKTENEAVMNAAVELGVVSERIEYEVIEKEKSGFLGIGSKNAKIRARVKEEVNAEPVKEVEVKPEEKKVEKKEAEKKAVKTEKKKSEDKEITSKEDKFENSADFEDEVEAKEHKAPKVEISDEEIEKIKLSAKMFLDKVFDAMHMQVAYDISFEKSSNTLELDLSGDEMGILIGKRGQTLDALQYLTGLVVNKQSEPYIKVKLDTENYRQRRKETLENLAQNIARKVKRTKSSVTLEAMNPYERRIIHSALQSDKYVDTHSEGEEPYRKVVVSLKKEYKDYNSGRNSHGKYGYKKNYRNNRYNYNKKNDRVEEKEQQEVQE